MTTKKQKIIIPTKVVIHKGYIPSKNRPEGHWIGMNYWAAQTLGVEWNYPKDHAIIVAPDSCGYVPFASWSIENVLRHEQVESEFMQKGDDYDTAHRKTLDLVGWGSKYDVDRRTK
jgi:hypothetical protein